MARSCGAIVGEALLDDEPAADPRRRQGVARANRAWSNCVWGEASAPKVTLVGKGVCFDTGGLDIKPATRRCC
jgi:leucyl aminopeptidase